MGLVDGDISQLNPIGDVCFYSIQQQTSNCKVGKIPSCQIILLSYIYVREGASGMQMLRLSLKLVQDFYS